MNIWFLRHGESEANVRGVFAGQRDDSPLTTKGVAQAVAAAEELKQKHIEFAEIVYSPLKRTEQTFLAVQKVLDLPSNHIRNDSRIIEYDMGDLTGTPGKKVRSKELISVPGAEDPELFRKRILSFLREMQTKPSGDYLLISHAGVGRCIEAARLNMPAESFYDLDPYPNAHAIILNLAWLSD